MKFAEFKKKYDTDSAETPKTTVENSKANWFSKITPQQKLLAGIGAAVGLGIALYQKAQLKAFVIYGVLGLIGLPVVVAGVSKALDNESQTKSQATKPENVQEDKEVKKVDNI